MYSTQSSLTTSRALTKGAGVTFHLPSVQAAGASKSSGPLSKSARAQCAIPAGSRALRINRASDTAFCRIAAGPQRTRKSRRALRASVEQSADTSLLDGLSVIFTKDGNGAELELVAGVKVIPHPDKVEKGGEDAYLISRHGAGTIVVADGVGGWAEDGVDPALYSRELMERAQGALDSEVDLGCDPRRLLEIAHEGTSSVGAATAIAAMMDQRGLLRVASLGDCGLRILRNGEIVFGTPPLQHFFDCPFQFGSESTDRAADSLAYELEMADGDVVVMASDGLFDNVFDRDIEAVARAHRGGADAESAEALAEALASLAREHSADPIYNSPYSQEAINQGVELTWWEKMTGKTIAGGKPDDITVVVAHVVPSKSSADTLT